MPAFRSLRLPASAFLLSCLAALPAQADEGGLPQLDTSLFPEQLFWLAVSFGLLFLMMNFVALPGVARVQDKRRQVIGAALGAAGQANGQAKAIGHEADRALSEARAKANAAIAAIKAEASKIEAEQQAAQSKQLNIRLRDAESAIAATRDKALKEIEGAAGDLAAAIVESVSGKVQA
jgi:F-type H+-transporting ATPase subunit b